MFLYGCDIHACLSSFAQLLAGINKDDVRLWPQALIKIVGREVAKLGLVSLDLRMPGRRNARFADSLALSCLFLATPSFLFSRIVIGLAAAIPEQQKLLYFFDEYALDTDRRELRRGDGLLPVEPKVFDLLVYLIDSRDRVVSQEDLMAGVWMGRVVSDSAD